MQVANVMKALVAVIGPEDSVCAAAVLMRDHAVGLLPVVDDAGRPIGVVTDRDLVVRAMAEDVPASRTRVADVMTRPVVACRADAEVWMAERLMLTQKKARVVCVDDDGVVVGILSLYDVALWDDSRRTLDVLQHLAEREPNR